MTPEELQRAARLLWYAASKYTFTDAAEAFRLAHELNAEARRLAGEE